MWSKVEFRWDREAKVETTTRRRDNVIKQKRLLSGGDEGQEDFWKRQTDERHSRDVGWWIGRERVRKHLSINQSAHFNFTGEKKKIHVYKYSLCQIPSSLNHSKVLSARHRMHCNLQKHFLTLEKCFILWCYCNIQCNSQSWGATGSLYLLLN